MPLEKILLMLRDTVNWRIFITFETGSFIPKSWTCANLITRPFWLIHSAFNKSIKYPFVKFIMMIIRDANHFQAYCSTSFCCLSPQPPVKMLLHLLLFSLSSLFHIPAFMLLMSVLSFVTLIYMKVNLIRTPYRPFAIYNLIQQMLLSKAFGQYKLQEVKVTN